MKILPKELRTIVYYVSQNFIINAKQRLEHPNFFQIEPTAIRGKKKECHSEMDNETNRWSFVYVHENGNIETEINVSAPKYAFHEAYSSEAVPALL